MLADWFDRSAVAAAQVIDGFDEDRFRALLEDTTVGVSASTVTAEAEALLDLLVRLLARLYPALAIRVDGEARERMRERARAINPAIELVDEAALGVVVGDGEPFAESVFCGCDGFDALVGGPQAFTTGDSANPLGAGAAACLAAASVFRRVFLEEPAATEGATRFSALAGTTLNEPGPQPTLPAALAGDAVLVGAGAIGQAALWAMARLALDGHVHVVDGETIELSNLQRYVLSERADEGAVKVRVATRGTGRIALEPHEAELAGFLAEWGYSWPMMLLALDSAADRVAAQASLPEWIVNAWTQPGDLGVAAHSRFGGDGACVSCMYLPEGTVKNEDELVAEALGVPQLQQQVRTLLYTGAGVERPLLEAVAQAIGRPVDVLLPFEGKPVRDLYVEGFCGGAVIPLDEAGKLTADAQEMHVPLAHQSALAGVLAAAAVVRHALEGAPEVTRVTRVDVIRPLGAELMQPQRARRDGRCICDDQDFVTVYNAKYASDA